MGGGVDEGSEDRKGSGEERRLVDREFWRQKTKKERERDENRKGKK